MSAVTYGAVPAAGERSRNWRIFFNNGNAPLVLEAAKLMGADGAWVRFRKFDGKGVLFPSSTVTSLEEI